MVIWGLRWFKRKNGEMRMEIVKGIDEDDISR